jgi:hypothetical protein
MSGVRCFISGTNILIVKAYLSDDLIYATSGNVTYTSTLLLASVTTCGDFCNEFVWVFAGSDFRRESSRNKVAGTSLTFFTPFLPLDSRVFNLELLCLLNLIG